VICYVTGTKLQKLRINGSTLTSLDIEAFCFLNANTQGLQR